MPAHIALLRAVNVAGHQPVTSADLRDLMERLGLAQGRTLLQSGNLVFESGNLAYADLERQLETEAEKRFGFRTDFFVRTRKEWDEMIAANPFVAEADNDPSHLLVMALRNTPAPDAEAALNAAITGRERVRVLGRQAYIIYPDGIGRSRVTTSLIERKLGSPGTGRNWNTVRKLAELAKG